MSGATSTPLTEEDVREMATAEIEVNRERCARLVAHDALLQRLPDGGAGIRQRHGLFTRELERRRAAEAKAAEDTTAPTTAASQKRANEAAMLDEAATTSSSELGGAAAAALEMGRKYKDQRVDVEATVRRMYGGALNEPEIQRIVKSVPPFFFLTYAETCERERQLARETRKAELQRLAAQTTRHATAPQ